MRNVEYILLVSLFLLVSCEKKEVIPNYDIFPLNVGNEYYYDYYYKWDKWNYGHTITGNEKWVVVSKSKSSSNTTYSVERTLSGVYVSFTGWSSSDRIYDTTHVYTDSVSFMNISEDLDSKLISFNKPNNCYYFSNTNLNFTRYIKTQDTLIIISIMSAREAWFYFSEDSGLTKYHFYKFGNSGTEYESLELDGLKIIP